jgi:microsomal dipeptidase-like Zn-dependent dipeptidase
MLVDLHAHYPMHLVPSRTRLGSHLRRGPTAWRALQSPRSPLGLRERFQALVVGLVSLFFNYRSIFSGPRVRMEYMADGEVGVALSVLYSPFDEVRADDDAERERSYVEDIVKQMGVVEGNIADHHADVARIAPNPAELLEARAEGKIALVHCVEGGFHLGGDVDDIRAAVNRLADLGVAYVTLAHLFWRGIATDAPALPFMSDEDYRKWFPQPDDGLSDLGEEAVRAMHARRMLIDLSHMSERSLHETLDLLDDLDRSLDRQTPVVATHTGYRFKPDGQEYLLDTEAIKRIAARNGVIGLIFAQHQLYDGLTERSFPRWGRPLKKSRRFDDALWVLRQHIDRIHEITGSHEHIAIGSDLDGFIKPTLPGLQDMRDMLRLQSALHEHYGADAELICSGNGMRLLTEYWGGGPGWS